MSHDQNLRKAGLPTVETLTKRILAVFDRATATDIESGARWYDEAGDLASSLAAQHSTTVEHTAAVISALSPRTPWSRNVAGAVALYETGQAPGCIGRNVETAERAMVEGYGAINGPKTSRFARNIAGDRESVTVDVWAARVARIDENLLTRKGVYDAVEAAYQRAARRVGLDPATMQATTWIVARNGRAA